MAGEVLNNLSTAFRHHAREHPDKPYVVSISRGTGYTYAEIDRLVDRACVFFKSLGLAPQDVVSAVLKNDIPYIVLYLASLRYGTIFNPYPFTMEPNDIARYLRNVPSRQLLCQERHFADLKPLCSSPAHLITDDFLATLEGSAEPWPAFEPFANSVACLYYSSGTTGNPKNISFSHRNMVANISSLVRGFRFDANEVHLIVLPLGHTASINYSFLPCTLTGGTIILAESFWKIRPRFWSIVREHKATYVELVPSILLASLNTPYAKEEFQDLKSLRYIGCGSSTLPRDRQVQFIETYGVRVANLYGLSETGPTHTDYPLAQGWEPGSIGIPLDVNEVVFMDKDDRIVNPGEVGEIAVKGEDVFVGYLNNHEQYDRAVRDGYFHTGDLGYLGKDGKHYFVGRKKDLIIKGGINIAPDEIDEILYKLPGVNEALTVGMPDDYLGEKITAHIVVKEGQELTEQQVIAHCRESLSRDKLPDSVCFVSSIPKGHSGKMLRRELRGRLTRELEQAKVVAREIGQVQLKHFNRDLRVIRKSTNELVSNVDMECQQLACDLLKAAFSYPVLSEEVRDRREIESDRFWVIDPLDGTHNFVAGLPLFGVSVGLFSEGKFRLGVIFLPFFDRMIWAEEGQGAFVNGERVHVSSNKALHKSMVTYDNQFHLGEKAFRRYQELARVAFTTRILGSAVFDFNLIASTKIDARVWNSTKFFDFAAGVVIIQEAGGRVTDFRGRPVGLRTQEVVASNGFIHDEILRVLALGDETGGIE